MYLERHGAPGARRSQHHRDVSCRRNTRRDPECQHGTELEEGTHGEALVDQAVSAGPGHPLQGRQAIAQMATWGPLGHHLGGHHGVWHAGAA